jgi:hypothetical protein
MILRNGKFSGKNIAENFLENFQWKIFHLTSLIVTALFISFFEGRMFSRWIVTKITSARGTLHCRKTRFLAGINL